MGGCEGLHLPDSVRTRISRGDLGGVILFKRNIDSLAQVAEINVAAQTARPANSDPIFVSIDQEGGPVARLRGLITDLPAMREVGRLKDPRLSADLGEMWGNELNALGFNLNFAPVMDVDTEPDNPVIAQRAFSSSPEEVARLAGAFATGLLVGGVLPCPKHFPGHGDTTVDSHVSLPVSPHDLQRLRQVELVPFKSVIRAKLPLIMSAHIVLSQLDPELPATLSEVVLNGLLRERMGYGGAVISDDLEMGAIAEHYPIADVVRLGLKAGLDLFLICHTEDKQEAAREAAIHLAESDSGYRLALETASQRVSDLRRKYLARTLPDETHLSETIGCPAHRELAQRLAQLINQAE
ncbi:MAG: beta-N-acetylhexosaminidase [Myxococcales bacterium]|nr:beta-N-acetylhexosaminidase [Myxococcales bacterium]